MTNRIAGGLRTYLLWLLCCCTLVASAQGAYERYIDQYKGMAIDQMKRYGIPASITLAQGLLESGAGTSRLAREANNHFGIKVSGTWDGPYLVKSDDTPNDRFRVYRNVADSYEDHSKFLRFGKRYASLFDLRLTDYKGWANGLKRAGYATNPRYASSLIDLIERYNLHDLDRHTGGRNKDHIGQEGRKEKEKHDELQRQATRHSVGRCNGQYYVIAKAGDTYASIAKEMRTKEKKLRSYNDVPDERMRLKAGDVVYLGKKRKRADRSIREDYHIMEAGESLYSISQRFGIRLGALCTMNPMRRGDHFEVGDRIRIK